MTRWLSLTRSLAAALLAAVSCGGEGAREGTGGAAGTGAQGEGGACEETDAAHLLALDVCERFCAQYRYFELTYGSCEPGTRLYHNQVLGEAGAGGLPEGEAPRCGADPFVDTCVMRIFNGEEACWQEALDSRDCMAEGVWVCDQGGGWIINEC